MRSEDAVPLTTISNGGIRNVAAPCPLSPLDSAAGRQRWGPTPVLREAPIGIILPGIELVCTVCRTVEERWAEMMRQAQTGDRARYATLLLEIGNWLDRDVLGSMGILERRMLVGSILTSVHHKRRTYLPGQSFLGWLVAIVDHHQRHPRKAHGCETFLW